MTARDRILERVRRGLAAHPGDDLRRARVEERIRDHRRGTTPARAAGDTNAWRALFVTMAREASATVELLASNDEIPGKIADYLRDLNLPSDIRVSADPLLADLPWANASQLEVSHGIADGDTKASLSVATAAAAETGTLAMTAGPQNPTTLNFLPENHIIVLPASRIRATYEDVWEALREIYGQGQMPRVVNFITGPSRTADIEQTLLMGAHGPKRLHILIVEHT